jgi:hypothetical protein
MQLIDPNHPAYRPLWVRLLVVGVCLGWGILEAVTGTPFWAVIVGALGIYSAWVLLWTFNPQPPEEKVVLPEETEDPNPENDRRD